MLRERPAGAIQPVRVEKALVTRRASLHASARPPIGGILSPEQVAGFVAWLPARKPATQKPIATN